MKYSNIILVPLLCVVIQTARGGKEITTRAMNYGGSVVGDNQQIRTVQRMLRQRMMDTPVTGIQQIGSEQQNVYTQNQNTPYVAQSYGQQKGIPYAPTQYGQKKKYGQQKWIPYAPTQYGQKKKYKYKAPKHQYKYVKVYRPKFYVYHQKPTILKPTHEIRRTYETLPPLKFFYTTYDATMARIHVAPKTMQTTYIKSLPRPVPVVQYFKGPLAFKPGIEPDFRVMGMGNF